LHEEWVGLVWVAEFSDLRREPATTAPTRTDGRSGVSARLDPLRLQTVGVRGLVDELFAALDSTLSRPKLGTAFAATVVLFVGLYAGPIVLRRAFDPPDWVPIAAGAGFALIVVSLLNAVLTRLTHLELTAMRPARLADAVRGFSRYAFSAVAANALVAGTGLVILFLIHGVPVWMRSQLDDAGLADAARTTVMVIVLLLVYLVSTLIWLLVGLCWLLTPAIVVEETGWVAGIREWRRLVRDHFGRVLVYEGLTLLLGVSIALPLTAAVGLALAGTPAADNGADTAVRAAMLGLTAAPLLAFLPVANVFIYLNLRYEQR
jgi:hypothetical protein